MNETPLKSLWKLPVQQFVTHDHAFIELGCCWTCLNRGSGNKWPVVDYGNHCHCYQKIVDSGPELWRVVNKGSSDTQHHINSNITAIDSLLAKGETKITVQPFYTSQRMYWDAYWMFDDYTLFTCSQCCNRKSQKWQRTTVEHIIYRGSGIRLCTHPCNWRMSLRQKVQDGVLLE